MNITEFIFTVECFQNGERTDFMRGWNVHAAPGHHYSADFATLEEARDDIRRLKDDFFMRDGGDYDRIFDEQGEDAADKARAEFVKSGSIDDDMNYYGIRKFEVFCRDRSCIAHILSNDEGDDFAATCAALDRFEFDYEVHDESEFAGEEDPREAADDANWDGLSGCDFDSARRFVEVCE